MDYTERFLAMLTSHRESNAALCEVVVTCQNSADHIAAEHPVLTKDEAVLFAIEDYAKEYIDLLIDDAGAGLGETAASAVQTLTCFGRELVDFRRIAQYFIDSVAEGATP